MFAEEIIAGAYICPNKRELLWQWGELSNPDNEQYWGAWDTVLNNCILEDKWGNKFTLYQNDDLWAVPEGYDVEEFFQ
jgi:hypothetical protein